MAEAHHLAVLAFIMSSVADTGVWAQAKYCLSVSLSLPITHTHTHTPLYSRSCSQLSLSRCLFRQAKYCLSVARKMGCSVGERESERERAIQERDNMLQALGARRVGLAPFSDIGVWVQAKYCLSVARKMGCSVFLLWQDVVRWVQDSGFRVQGSGFKGQGSGFRAQGSGFRV